jgi:hypothetical protein
MAKKQDDAKLLAVLTQEETDSVGYYTSEIADQQEQALKYYRGDQFGDEVEGRSTVVSRDVAEVIDWQIPDLLRVFMGGKEAVRFEPQNPDDEAAAEQATDYVNHIFWNENDGFQIMHDWFKDALLQKVGVVKVFWDETDEVSEEIYEGQPGIALQQLEADPEVEILEYEEAPVAPQPGYEDGLAYTVKVRRTRTKGKVCLEGIAPEEFLISKRAVTVDGARYKAHRTRKTRSELIEMGFSKKVVEELSSGDHALDTRETQRFDDEEWYEETSGGAQEATDEVIVLEEYINYDANDDGVAELIRVLRVGNDILEWDAVDDHPFASLCPNPTPHKFYGESAADKVMDIQRIKSVLQRQMLDNFYHTNNTRIAVNVDAVVEMDELLDSRPGGVVRMEGPPGEHIQPIQVGAISAQSFNMIEYLDATKEARTGITRYNQGMQADTLNKTATGINRIMDAAQGRKEMVARIFAETGVKTMFKKILKLVIAYQDAPRIVRLRGQWVPMDPRSWNAEMDVSINVGLGTGNKDQILMHLNAVAQKQEQIIGMLGPNNPIAPLSKYANTLKKLVDNAEVGDPSEFFTQMAPDQQLPPPPPNPEVMMAQQEQQMKGQETQAKMQADSQKVQLNHQKAMEEIRLKREEVALMVGQVNQKVQQSQADLELRHRELELREAESAAKIEIEVAKLEQAGVHKTADIELKMSEKVEPPKLRGLEVQRDENGEMIGVIMAKDDGSVSAVKVERDEQGNMTGASAA